MGVAEPEIFSGSAFRNDSGALLQVTGVFGSNRARVTALIRWLLPADLPARDHSRRAANRSQADEQQPLTVAGDMNSQHLKLPWMSEGHDLRQTEPERRVHRSRLRPRGGRDRNATDMSKAPRGTCGSTNSRRRRELVGETPSASRGVDLR